MRQGSIMTQTKVADVAESPQGVRRRDFIEVAAVSAAGVGALAVLVPLISQMAPSADVLAESSTEVDISAIAAGQAIKAVFRKQPVFVRHLTPVEIAEADKVPVEPARSRNAGPAHQAGQGAVADHHGRVHPSGLCAAGHGAGEPRGEFGGYFCPCHGSQYDTAARIRKGPAPKNLQVPEYAFTSPTVVKIG
jgi:ubiquinol-cytochrome c reductase iron-sulfur subunit